MIFQHTHHWHPIMLMASVYIAMYWKTETAITSLRMKVK